MKLETIAASIITFLILFAFLFLFFRIIIVESLSEQNYAEFCVFKFGEGYDFDSLETCRFINGTSGEILFKYYNRSVYWDYCEDPGFFDLSNWKRHCNFEEDGEK